MRIRCSNNRQLASNMKCNVSHWVVIDVMVAKTHYDAMNTIHACFLLAELHKVGHNTKVQCLISKVSFRGLCHLTPTRVAPCSELHPRSHCGPSLWCHICIHVVIPFKQVVLPWYSTSMKILQSCSSGSITLTALSAYMHTYYVISGNMENLLL